MLLNDSPVSEVEQSTRFIDRRLIRKIRSKQWRIHRGVVGRSLPHPPMKLNVKGFSSQFL